MILKVFYHEQFVGLLSDNEKKILFSYAPDWIEHGVEFSPLQLPLRQGVFENPDEDFYHLPGVFWDSVPDAWGMQILKRYFEGLPEPNRERTPLDILAHLGNRTMGALSYLVGDADHDPIEPLPLNLANLCEDSSRLQEGKLLRLSPLLDKVSSPAGGAKPKILVGLKGDQMVAGDLLPDEYEGWIIKLAIRNSSERTKTEHFSDARMEYAYSLMARAAGVDMAPTRLFPDSKGGVHFGTQRFDRCPGKGEERRIHYHSYAGITHSFHRQDYAKLLDATMLLCRDYRQVIQQFRRLVFNIAASNCDDHAKNFGFLMSADGTWSVAPAFDVTCAPGMTGRVHAMTVDGKIEPSRKDLEELARKRSIGKEVVNEVFERVLAAVDQWPQFAREAGLKPAYIAEIQETQKPGLRSLQVSPFPAMPPPPPTRGRRQSAQSGKRNSTTEIGPR
jgi:serine/threonine-protein kinase HipA